MELSSSSAKARDAVCFAELQKLIAELDQGAADAISVASMESGASDQGAARLLQRFHSLRNSMESMMDKLTRDSARGLDFLSNLRRPAAQDASTEMRRFIERFQSEVRTATPKRQSELVIGFYEEMKSRMDNSAVWREVDEEQCQAVLDGLERYIMQHIYDIVFASAEEDEIKDLSVQARIRQLHWMTPEHLEANIKLDVPEVASAIETAQEELITMDAKRAPQDKLACVVACSKSIFDILSKSAGEGNAMAASADDFLPALIYVLIKANPPMLHSNMEFINRFCNPDRLMAGEAGYYYTNLMGAASFVENLNAEQLKMDTEKFDRLMQGDNIDITEGLDSIRLLKESLERLRRLENKQKVLQMDVSLLMETISLLCASAVKPVPSVPEEALTATDFAQRHPEAVTPPSKGSKSLRRSVSSPPSPTPRY